MENIFRILLFIAGAINILPSILAFIPGKISESYGIDIPNADFELLLRHRAVLFGIVGGLMIYAAIFRKFYQLSIVVGLISMISFIILYFQIGGINVALEKVMKIDLVAILLLIIGTLLYEFKS